ncbi:dTMP kinase [Sodalis sp. CWE]|uniref:dTMP kinase n=1 Tax=Sodalis sp. CWE TaxID=2803816 RepID=UPI001C7D6547|nr:dTMP kinase [Sodalis sp. CWE]MBX4181048.1 dTMP kinase [Sodalis sp. CWE]
MNGKFIVIEGQKGAGKTSAVTQVIKTLKKYGIKDVIATREPGGTPLAEALRKLIKHGVNDESITDHAELLMLYAARAQLLEKVIKPALIRGTWVIGDRHDLSSQAYQGGGRGISTHLLQTLRNSILGNFSPDLTFYLDVLPKIGIMRSRERFDKGNDRIGTESTDFFDRTYKQYQTLAAKEDRIITIDANQSLVSVKVAIHDQLKKWLNTQQVLSLQ